MIFGRDVPCRKCHGSGMSGQMDAEAKRQRARDLRLAKREGTDPPKLSRHCVGCGGRGYTTPAEADRSTI